ncbi:LLM class flavin-dependent oxidoreductase [Herbidospora sp. NEAU-GS84]|uniref:LLM class flavin-dependent oxidoreductase n=1 Tax=Herbidospora solisilvae TaxID=2696284 RepID=A0A7C9MWL1_9ACTN|nr:LLM class flavin-dependent oxidoreductase [Herbidospora solisilvae]NAS22371.1 LLM class flavin-dependent oxidoreductase [Herbidospora solisilvae]
MRAGITILPEHRRPELERRWRAAEAYGFAHAWTFDHLGWRTLVDGPWFGSVPTLSAAAMVTSTIEIGLLVSSPNFRHPVPFARELTALDDLSQGRFTLGIGAGSRGDYDSRVLGWKPASRHARYAEFVELLDLLLREERVSWSGDYYEAVEARNTPGCVQRPRLPFLVAADGPKAMALAARFGDGWVTLGGRGKETLDAWWAAVAEASRRFDDVLADLGRPREGVRRFLQSDSAPVYSLSSVECYRDFVGRSAELGYTDMAAPWPRETGIWAGDESVLDAVAADVLPELRRAP